MAVLLEVSVRPVDNGYVVVIRWDAGKEEMVFSDATEAIEFALKNLKGEF